MVTNKIKKIIKKTFFKLLETTSINDNSFFHEKTLTGNVIDI